VILFVTITLLFLIGYSSQRSGVCMVRAVREVIERRRVHRLAGFLLAAASAMLVMAAAEALGGRPFTTLMGAQPDASAIAGGLLFGLGTLLSGHCAIGTLAALTAGQMSRLAALGAMFLAAFVLGPNMSSALLMTPPRAPLVSPLAGNELLALAVGGVLAALAATYIYRRIGWRKPRDGWSPLVAMTVVGAASGVLFALDQHWVYTSRLAEIAYGELRWSMAAIAGPLALITGMVVAAMIGGMFRLRLGTLREWSAAAGGGFLMGIGATLVPGGNDTMLFTGIPLLLPNLLAAYAAFFVTLTIGQLLREKQRSGRLSAKA
jgi:uncharacterized protein